MDKLFAKPEWVFTTLEKKASENILGKGGNACNQHFLLFPNISYTSQNKFQILSHLSYRLQMLSVWTILKTLSFGKGLSASNFRDSSLEYGMPEIERRYCKT